MTDAQVTELKHFFETSLSAAISQSEMRVIELLSDRMDDGFASFRQEMKEDFATFRQEMKEDFATFRQEMDEGFTAVRREMHDGFAGAAKATEDLANLLDRDHEELDQRLSRLEQRRA